MLHISLECRNTPNCYESGATQVVFSNVQIYEPIHGSIFSLTPSGSVGAAWAYVLTVRVFSPPLRAGTVITPQNELLDEVRALLGYILDIELTEDVDGCRALSGGRNTSNLSRLIPNRFDPSRVILSAQLVAPTETFERVISAPDGHLLVVLRAVKAYERAMLALARGQLDLAYVLLVFVLECLAQTRPVPECIAWEDYPPSQRNALDKVVRRRCIPEDTAGEIREILTSARHLRATENFREFVLCSLTTEFFGAVHPTPSPRGAGLRLRRSLLPRLLAQAYAVRSGFAHALAPIAVAVSAHADSEFCGLLDGSLALTFRGLHRIVREVMSAVLLERRQPSTPIPRPEMPGIIYARWSYEYWIYRHLPRSDGADARYWFTSLLELHVAFCVRPASAAPPHPIPIEKIGSHVLACNPDKANRPAVIALAWICGQPPTQHPRLTIETLVAKVFCLGGCGEDVHASARVLDVYLDQGVPQLDLPVYVEIAMEVAVAEGFREIGDLAKCQRWLEIARDDAVSDPQLQARLAAALPEESAVTSNSLLFPRTTPGRLLEGFSE